MMQNGRITSLLSLVRANEVAQAAIARVKEVAAGKLLSALVEVVGPSTAGSGQSP